MSSSHPPTARGSATTARGSPSTVRARDSTAVSGGRRARGDAPLVLGRYRLHRRMGAGAFGTVWMARDERLDREVAVKIVSRERIVGGRFEREARAAARLSHPSIVTLYEAAIDDDGAYLVSELVRGATLHELLEAGRLSDRDVVRVSIALCDALIHAHSQGVVHRDVKPSNVLIPEQPASPAQVAKLTDFGVARVMGGDSLTRTGDVVGTAAYMAPEQAEGLEAGAPADLYALALVTYEALTGVNPVRTGTAAQRARRLGAHLPPLRRQRRELPRELGRAVDLALRPRPRERGTVEELREALSQTLPLMHDTPGVVTGAWPARDERDERDRRDQAPAGVAHNPSSQPQAPDEGEPAAALARRVAAVPRALAAAGAAGLTGWLSTRLLAPAPIAPPAAALLAGVLVAALPRIGWLALTAALGAGAIAQHRPGGALILVLAALLPIVLMPRRGAAWALAAGAPALGLIGLAGAWPALAARVSGPWRRAALGATGWTWLVLAGPLNGAGLYVREPAGTPPPDGWIGSVHQTVELVLRPLLSSGALAGAPVWAAGALVLPWLVKQRSLTVRIVLVTAWAATVASASETAISLIHPGSGLLPGAEAAAGAVAGALVVLAPGVVQGARLPRARGDLP